MTVGLLSFGSTFTGSSGKGVLGGFNANSNAFQFMNFAKSGASQDGQMQAGASNPSGLTANGYPTTTAPAGCSSSVFLPAVVGVSWVLKWRNNVSGAILLNTAVTVTAVGGTVGGITYGTGGISLGSQSFLQPLNVTRPRIVFTFNTPLVVSAILNFPTGGTYNGDMDVVLCRLSDETDLDAGGIFTPEWLAAIRPLNPKIIRFMGQTLNAGNDATMACQTSYRPSVNAFSWANNIWPPGLWAGSITNTGDTYACGAQPDYAALGSGYVEGMTWQGTFKGATTNTTTTPTINLNGLGAKTLLNPAGQALTVGALTLSNCTFIYDAVLDGVLYHNGGITYGPPLEIKVAQCNAVQKDYWHTIPTSYTLPSVLSDATYIAANLRTGLNCYPELCNENWNTAFNQFALCALRGRALGFSSSSSQDILGYQGMRSRQMFAHFTTAFVNRSTTLKRVLASQAFASLNNNDVSLFQGQPLAASGTGLGSHGAGNALWTSYTGGADYTQIGQRPIDWCDIISYAPYVQPAQVGQSDVDYTANIGAANMTDLLTNADLYATGNPISMATALAWYDNQVRRGTFPVKTISSVSGGNTFNSTAHGFTNGKPLIFQNIGTISGVSLAAVYYAANVATNTFQIVAAIGGTVISGISGGSGTETVGRGFNGSLLEFDVGGSATSGTLLIAGIYPRWEALASTYSKDVVCYEAGPVQGCGPSTGACTSLGISTSYGDTSSGGTITVFGTIGTLINAYRNSAYGSQIVIDEYKQFMGTDSTSPNFGLLPHSKQPAALAMEGQSQWSLYPGDIITTTPYQTYYGVQAFNNS